MKKRLRKKKRIGEFKESGFKIGFRFLDELSTESIDHLIDRFIEQAIENNGLQFGGGGKGSEWDGFVVLDKHRGSATDLHREAVKQWFMQESEILEYHVTQLIDAWYGDFDNVKIEW